MTSDKSTQHVINIKGMTCPRCAHSVTSAIQSVPDVKGIHVTVTPGQATFTTGSNPDQTTKAVAAAIEQAGYTASLPDSDLPPPDSGPAWAGTVWLGASVTALLMIGEWGFRLGHESWFRHTAFLLSGLVQLICGAGFYRGAWRQLKRGDSNMDTLVSLGSTAAFGFSTWALFTDWNGHLYFMESAAIISLVSIGHLIESRVGTRAESALKSLLHLAPETALKRRTDGGEVEVPVASLTPADEVILKPGDKIPVDGKILEGTSSVDESMLTGESVPASKGPGRQLFAGTHNLDGTLVMQVTATGRKPPSPGSSRSSGRPSPVAPTFNASAIRSAASSFPSSSSLPSPPPFGGASPTTTPSKPPPRFCRS
jgi:P-type Cu+ transporter